MGVDKNKIGLMPLEVHELFKEESAYTRQIDTYFFRNGGRIVESKDTRDLFCLFQINLMLQGKVFLYDFDADDKKKYLTSNKNPQEWVLKKLANNSQNNGKLV